MVKKPAAIGFGQEVDKKDFSLWTRIKARFIWPVKVWENPALFLAYCGDHKIYFTDSHHTNTGPRCPACDLEWLRKRGILQDGT